MTKTCLADDEDLVFRWPLWVVGRAGHRQRPCGRAGGITFCQPADASRVAGGVSLVWVWLGRGGVGINFL